MSSLAIASVFPQDNLIRLQPEVTQWLKRHGGSVVEDTFTLRSALFVPAARAGADVPTGTSVRIPAQGVELEQIGGPRLKTINQRCLQELITLYIVSALPDDYTITVTKAKLLDRLRTDGHKNSARKTARPPAEHVAWLNKVLAPLEQAWFRIRRSETEPERLRSFPAEERFRFVQTVREDWTASGEPSLVITLCSAVTPIFEVQKQLVLINRETAKRLDSADPMAFRLWSFLEGEQFPDDVRSYGLFPSPAGGVRFTVSALLYLDGYEKRSEAVRRLRNATAVIREHDPRYRSFEVVSQGSGQWSMRVERVDKLVRNARLDDGLSLVVHGKWRGLNGGKRPSAKQREVLLELQRLHGVDGLCRKLEDLVGVADPFRALLDTEREVQVQIRAREAAWEKEKLNDAAMTFRAADIAEEPVSGILSRFARRKQDC